VLLHGGPLPAGVISGAGGSEENRAELLSVRVPRAAGAPLVEEDQPVAGGIEEATVNGVATGSRAAVQEDSGYARRVAAFLQVNLMALYAQPLGGIGLEGRIEFRGAGHNRGSQGEWSAGSEDLVAGRPDRTPKGIGYDSA